MNVWLVVKKKKQVSIDTYIAQHGRNDKTYVSIYVHIFMLVYTWFHFCCCCCFYEIFGGSESMGIMNILLFQFRRDCFMFLNDVGKVHVK